MMYENKDNFSLNKTLLNLDVYASKAISLQAKNNPDIVNLSFGEPVFGPPDYSLNDIATQDLNLESFLNSAKRYEESRGSFELRQVIANWYKRRYDLDVDPETEIMITHGGVEAITLAILSTSEIGDVIAITDPSYMLYQRTIMALGRQPGSIQRPRGGYEYQAMFDLSNSEGSPLTKAKALIINSPENPSGYVVDQSEWDLIRDYAHKKGLWVIHDEVYDTMAYKRKHGHIRMGSTLSDRTILINSFSKKFGIPGLRIGWMVAHKKVIELASKVHDYLYLGVNIQYEKIV
jgi:aminotransferase